MDKSEVYKRSYGGKAWLCRPCDAWVLAHKDAPYRPTGTLAKSLLRALRLKAVCLFEQVWRTAAQDTSRSQDEWRHMAYQWLANQMGISPDRCQIGYFSHVQTQIVINICSAAFTKKEAA